MYESSISVLVLLGVRGFDSAALLLANCETERRPVAILHKSEARFVMFADLLFHTAAFVEGGNRSSLVFVSHQSVLAKNSWPVVSHEHTIKHLKRSKEIARNLKQSKAKPRIQAGAIIDR